MIRGSAGTAHLHAEPMPQRERPRPAGMGEPPQSPAADSLGRRLAAVSRGGRTAGPPDAGPACSRAVGRRGGAALGEDVPARAEASRAAEPHRAPATASELPALSPGSAGSVKRRRTRLGVPSRSVAGWPGPHAERPACSAAVVMLRSIPSNTTPWNGDMDRQYAWPGEPARLEDGPLAVGCHAAMVPADCQLELQMALVLTYGASVLIGQQPEHLHQPGSLTPGRRRPPHHDD